MTDKIELNAVKNIVRKNSVGKWITDNYWMLIFTGLFATGAYSLISSAAEHKFQVQEISKQNAGCIYLESSKLGDGQHYMICEGQIVLKRLSDQVSQVTPEEKLEEVVPTNATATPPPAK
ncbi:MAG: hypothetical protein EBU66_20115 [Bacteroidetes bacterium]|nr:hypothetical protein [Bacteroidota bacterium]